MGCFGKRYSSKNSRDCSGKPTATGASGTRCGGYGASSGIDRRADVEQLPWRGLAAESATLPVVA